ncbi:DUF1631 family protein [Oleiagrimonas soli]|uniref:Thymidine phosphorylase n=1 Tax=Oleiagrimonas soli TaxID=1543381 RepID=A0A099CVL1_9GAMM|nr:DUF1631 family protein [Oleiagrimonas soli]KGI77819.1 hypothetical protein LF63_0105205 [Oleiagrimonas soli]MBB6183845.1 hypothetical protein [Oleiagrimonas soli]
MHHEPSSSEGRTNTHRTAAAGSERSKRLLTELRTQCSAWLNEPLERGLTHFGHQLQELANGSRSHLDQQSYLDTMSRLREHRQAFDQQFTASIDKAFDQLGAQAGKVSASAPRTLSLLDTMTHDLDAALDQLVARSKVRGGQELIELGYRIAVLLGTAPVESSELPVGPQAMARAFRDASNALKMPTAHELLLLQSLESSLIDELASLHALVNTHLREAGILPGLRPFALPRDPSRQSGTRKASTAAVAPTPAASIRAEPAASETPSHKTAAGKPSAGTSAEGRVSNDQLQAALTALQEHFAQVDERTWFELNQPKRLREELLLQLNARRSAQTGHVDLDAEQEYTLEMIVRLFAKIAQQLPQTLDAQSLLYDLQLPLLRVALRDPSFFEQHRHPARQVLGRITEIARDWLDDASESPHHELRIDLEALIVHAGRAAPEAAVYEKLLEGIERQVARLQHETQLVEEQQVDAMRGLERLEEARHRTAELLSERVAASPRQQAALQQMHRSWMDVMSLTLLRNGEDSTAFKNRLYATEQVLGIRPLDHADMLRQELEIGLRQIGMPADEIDPVVSRMIEAGRAAQRRPGPDTDHAPASVETPPSAIGAANDAAAFGSSLKASPEVLRIHRHLRTLPAGVWFEFRGPAGTQGIQRRLAWYSPLTGHSLFVTRSGRRAQELGELKLAQAIAAGHIRELTDIHENVVDQAWRIVTREQGLHPPTSHRGGA